MEFDRQKKIIVGVAVAIILLLIAFLTWKLWQKPASPNASPSQETVNQPSVLVTPPVTTAVPPVSAEQSTATRLARLFTERFGTFTSQGQFAGIRELDAVVTDSMRSWLDNTYIPGLRTKYVSSTYVAETTRVLGVSTDKINDTSAVMTVRTQQEFVNGDNMAVVTNPTLKVTLAKTDSVWQVDSATWASK